MVWGTEVLNEAAMVECASAALSTARIWDVHDLSSGIEDCGAMHGDAVKTIAETERAWSGAATPAS